MKNCGFSLVETLVVVVIVSVVMLAGMASYNRFNDKQTVKQAADELITQMRTLQKMASGAQQSVKCVGPTNTLSAYRLTYDDSNHYKTMLVCSNSSIFDTNDMTLPDGVTFTGSFSNIDFKPLSQGIDFTSAPTVKYGNCTVAININAGGVISAGNVVCS